MRTIGDYMDTKQRRYDNVLDKAMYRVITLIIIAFSGTIGGLLVLINSLVF